MSLNNVTKVNQECAFSEQNKLAEDLSMTNELFEKNKALIDAWLADLEKDPHHQAVMAEVKAYNKEIKRITSIVECDYDRHCGLIATALDYYLREAYRLEDLKKWK